MGHYRHILILECFFFYGPGKKIPSDLIHKLLLSLLLLLRCDLVSSQASVFPGVNKSFDSEYMVLSVLLNGRCLAV